jgi:hypothetical protein
MRRIENDGNALILRANDLERRIKLRRNALSFFVGHRDYREDVRPEIICSRYCLKNRALAQLRSIRAPSRLITSDVIDRRRKPLVAGPIATIAGEKPAKAWIELDPASRTNGARVV